MLPRVASSGLSRLSRPLPALALGVGAAPRLRQYACSPHPSAADVAADGSVDTAFVEGKVMELVRKHMGSLEDDSQLVDLSKKCRVISACEAAFGFPVPHSDLNKIDTIRDLVQYCDSRIIGVAEAARKAEDHWLLNL